MPSHARTPPTANTAGGYQTAAAATRAGSNFTDHQVTAAETASVTAASPGDPKTHPYWPTFLKRVEGLFKTVSAPADQSPASIAEDIWKKICAALLAAQPSMDAPGTYSNPSKGWVDMKSPGYDAAIGQFASVIDELAGYGSSQFNAAASYGFWSGGDGRKVAEAACDLTLETSGIGGIFDGIPTLDADAHGWDPDLWGGLSAGYARAIVRSIVEDDDKTIHVCLGSGARADNIWGVVESESIRTGLAGEGLRMEDFVTYHGVACADQSCQEPDWSKTSSAGMKGAVYSGMSWQDAVDAAKAHKATAPPAPTSGSA